MIWFRSANSHTGPQLHRCNQRPDRWQHPTSLPGRQGVYPSVDTR
jgi:hypothetical protein